MPITIDVRDGEAGMGMDEAFAELRRIDAVFSPFAPDSAVSRMNDGRLRIDDASAEVQDVLARCERYEASTGGFFSPWHGAVLDPKNGPFPSENRLRSCDRSSKRTYGHNFGARKSLP